MGSPISSSSSQTGVQSLLAQARSPSQSNQDGLTQAIVELTQKLQGLQAQEAKALATGNFAEANRLATDIEQVKKDLDQIQKEQAQLAALLHKVDALETKQEWHQFTADKHQAHRDANLVKPVKLEAIVEAYKAAQVEAQGKL